MFPSNSNLVNVNNMNAMNMNGTLSFNNLTQFTNNGMNGLTLNPYASINNVNTLTAMNSIVGGGGLNGLNLQNMNNQGATGFTPTFDGERSLAAGLNSADFGWPNNFVGIISDATSYQPNGNVTTNNANNQLNTSFGAMNMSFPPISKNLIPGLSNSTSPTNVLSNLTSLPGQPNIFMQNGMNQGNNVNNGYQQQRQDDSLGLKMMSTGNMLSMRNTNVNVGN